jgi:hypothetical protein
MASDTKSTIVDLDPLSGPGAKLFTLPNTLQAGNCLMFKGARLTLSANGAASLSSVVTTQESVFGGDQWHQSFDLLDGFGGVIQHLGEFNSTDLDSHDIRDLDTTFTFDPQHIDQIVKVRWIGRC